MVYKTKTGRQKDYGYYKVTCYKKLNCIICGYIFDKKHIQCKQARNIAIGMRNLFSQNLR